MKSKLKLLKSFANPIALNWRSLILIIFALPLLAACGSGPKVLTEIETKEVFIPVRTPLDAALLQNPEPCELPPTVAFFFFDLDQWAVCLEDNNLFYAQQLERIREANKKPPEGGEALNTGGGG